MKALIAIANFGTKNERYLARLLKEYRSMTCYEAHIVILSDIPKDFGPDIEVIVGMPAKNPWSLPFGYKTLFMERLDQYDLFIYSEDDTLITERNVDAFMEVTQVLPDNYIAGFIRYEVSESGRKYYSTIHSHYHWNPNSVMKIGNYILAHYTNEHSACFILTQNQLKKAIYSGGFLLPARAGRYGMPETASTDPYTQCGLKKMVCISHLENFSLHHLPNAYLGKMGISEAMLSSQIQRMIEIEKGRHTRKQLLDAETKLIDATLHKKYYEKPHNEFLCFLPKDLKSVLSVGCGWGANEEKLIKQGANVTGIPLDSVIASCAELRGIETTSPNFCVAFKELKNRRFDCVLFINILEYIEEPERIFQQFSSLLNPSGIVGIAIHNFNHLSLLKKKISKKEIYKDITEIGNYDRTGLHRPTKRQIQKLFLNNGLKATFKMFAPNNRYRIFSKISFGRLNPWISFYLYAFGRLK